MEKSLKEYMFGGILTAVTLLTGGFWKDAIEQTIDQLLPNHQNRKRIWISYVVALVITIILFTALYYIYQYVF